MVLVFQKDKNISLRPSWMYFIKCTKTCLMQGGFEPPISAIQHKPYIQCLNDATMPYIILFPTSNNSYYYISYITFSLFLNEKLIYYTKRLSWGNM